jgi:glycosyltransferase involved in cell wall biosynthesis
MSSPPLVVHAPFQPGVKGTRFVLDAVERLKAEGVELEFVLLEGKTIEEARRLYERADLLVDQLLLGWYGGIAVELMALGKPVVCHIRESDLGVLPEEMRAELPIIPATTETIYDVLREWLTQRRSELPEVGRRGRAFVERWHDPVKIAEGLKDVYAEIASP